jgi:quinol monooxygenase YgiN
MFAAIRYYQADPPSIEEVVRRVQEDFVPLIRDMRGFVSYFILVPSEREEDIVSVSVFEDQQSAEESNRKAAEWVVCRISASFFGRPRSSPAGKSSCMRLRSETVANTRRRLRVHSLTMPVGPRSTSRGSGLLLPSVFRVGARGSQPLSCLIPPSA